MNKHNGMSYEAIDLNKSISNFQIFNCFKLICKLICKFRFSQQMSAVNNDSKGDCWIRAFAFKALISVDQLTINHFY